MEINYQGIAEWLFIALVLTLMIALVLSSGCITAGKKTIRGIMETPTPTPTPGIMPTPSPLPVFQPVVYEADYKIVDRTNGRYLGEPFIITRPNVSGYKDLTFTLNVYRVDLKKAYEWNNPSWGTLQRSVQVAPPGYQYAIVFIRLETLGTRMWGFDENNFYFNWNTSHMQTADATHAPCVLIYDYANTGTINDDSYISDFGYYYKYKRSAETYGDQCHKIGWVKDGLSNAWDGYMIFVVPENIRVAECKLFTQLNGFGSPYWVLTDRD